MEFTKLISVITIKIYISRTRISDITGLSVTNHLPVDAPFGV